MDSGQWTVDSGQWTVGSGQLPVDRIVLAAGHWPLDTVVARGFESKDVEFQQAEATRATTVRRALTAVERDA